MKPIKTIASKNPKVDIEQLRESLKLSKQLAKSGAVRRKGYTLPSPYEQRIVKTSIAELALAHLAHKT